MSLAIAKGWHNLSALSYLNPSASHSSQSQPQNSNPNQFSGCNLSYGFAPNIVPSHIPNPSRENVPSHPIGWAIGGNEFSGGSFSNPMPQHDPVRSQVEIPCQAIRVSEDDMPNYLYKFPTVSRHSHVNHIFHEFRHSSNEQNIKSPNEKKNRMHM